jgi:hypothetical protein
MLSVRTFASDIFWTVSMIQHLFSLCWSLKTCVEVTNISWKVMCFLVRATQDLHYSKAPDKCCRQDRLQFQPPSAAPQPCGFHPNDILVNIKTRPGKFLVDLNTWKPESSSMYDLLQELQSLNNAHRKACHIITLYVLSPQHLWCLQEISIVLYGEWLAEHLTNFQLWGQVWQIMLNT